MLSSILPKINAYLRPRTFAGLSWQLGTEGGRCQLVILEQDKEAIHTTQKVVDPSDWEDLVKKIPKKTPVILHLHGKGILHKTITGPVVTAEQLLQQILPNAHHNQFYLQQTPVPNGVIGSIVRLDSLDELLAQLRADHIWITGVILGPVGVRHLFPFLHTDQSLHLSNHSLQFNEQGQLTGLTSLQGETDSYVLGEERWSADSLSTYAAAFCGLLAIPLNLRVDAVVEQEEELFSLQLFEKGKMVAMGVLLSILILNTFAYYFYKDKNNQLQGQLVQTKALLAELDSLKVRVNQQHDLFQATDIHQQSQTSFYADRIAATLPKGLQLTELELFPLDGRERDYDESSLRHYRQRDIRIKGICASSLSYNEWIKTLGELSWVQEARHLNYKDLSRKRGEFELQLLIAPSQ